MDQTNQANTDRNRNRNRDRGLGHDRETWAAIRDPSPDFVESVLATVRTIPPGRVMTYGDVAAVNGDHHDLEGAPGSYGARLVGNVMARFGHDVSWWRVIRSTGHPPTSYETRALAYYRDERTPLVGPEDNYRIDMKLARYDPEQPDEPVQATMF